MGGLVVISFVMVILSVFSPDRSLSWIHWTANVITALNLGFFGTRWWVLRQGWLPVSVDELKRAGIDLNKQPVEIQSTLLKLSRENGWLNWKEIWMVLGGVPALGDERWGGGLRWADGKDRLALHRDFLAGVPLAVRRSDKGEALIGDGFVGTGRERRRC